MLCAVQMIDNVCLSCVCVKNWFLSENFISDDSWLFIIAKRTRSKTKNYCHLCHNHRASWMRRKILVSLTTTTTTTTTTVSNWKMEHPKTSIVSQHFTTLSLLLCVFVCVRMMNVFGFFPSSNRCHFWCLCVKIHLD